MNTIFNKRIPTIISIILLLIGVAVTSILVQQGIIFFGHAAPSDAPQNIRITNMSDTSFTVTYTTDASVIGTLSLIESGQNPQTVLDERDQQSGVPKQYNIHSISAKNLTPATSYDFKILSGSTTYLNNDKPFNIVTANKITDTPTQQLPLAGKVILPNGTVPPDALIFVTTSNGQLLSTLQNSSGLYILPLNTLRTQDLSSPIKFTSESIIQILATNGPLVSHATIGIGSINPIPPITLSQDYDFTINNKPLATGSAQNSFPAFALDNTKQQATPEIITPKNNESFTDQQPQFQGTASPNSSVTISIHSTQAIQTQVKADSSGNWTYRPTTPLTPGQHTITITAPDKFGILHTIQQSFTVYAAGTQVNQSATPSATLAPTKVPTPTLKQSTPTPTSKIKQPTPTTTPTAITPAQTKGGLPISPKPSLPPTGSNTVAVVSIAGIATAAIGIVLFLMTTGASL